MPSTGVLRQAARRLVTRAPGPTRSRSTRLVAVIAVAGAAGGVALTAGGSTAGAAADYHAQAVGNFVDATAGGTPIDQLAQVAYASARAPGRTSVQNPLDVTALRAVELPLTNAVKLPSFAGIQLGAVNQLASAKTDGSSLGASGAVANSGGASVGGNDAAYPASATVNLTAAALSGTGSIPVGSSSLPSLGGVTLTVGGLSGIARTNDTPAAIAPKYTIADLELTLGSPALGGLLGQLSSALASNDLTNTLSGILGALPSNGGTVPVGGVTLPGLGTLPGGTVIPALPTQCTLTPENLGSTLTLDGGAVTIDAATGSIAINVRKLLAALNLDLDALPANTDLTTYLLDYLTSADGLTAGIENVINGSVSGLEDQFATCRTALGKLDPTHLLGGLVDSLTSALDSGRTQFEGVVNQLVGSLSGSGGAGNPLAPIGAALKNIVDIGANVQHGPGKASDSTDAPFTSALAATPKQGTDVVPNQTLVRALEIDLLDVSTGAGSSTGTGAPGAVIALGNAAAGPSTLADPVPSSPAPSTPATTGTATTSGPPPATASATTTPVGGGGVPSTAVPLGVPAGAAGHPTGSSTVPILLGVLGLLAASGGVVGYRRRSGSRR